MKNFRGKKAWLLLLLLVLVLSLLFLFLYVIPSLQKPRTESSPSIEDPAPTAEESTQEKPIVDYFEDTKLDLKPYAGKALFLNFFTEWCPYCMDEMPEIKKIFETYSQDELQIILVHVWDGEDEKNSLSIKEKYGLENLTFFEDEDMSLARFVGLPGYPTSLFIDKNGALNSAAASALDFEAMAKIIDSMGVARADEAVLPTSTPQ